MQMQPSPIKAEAIALADVLLRHDRFTVPWHQRYYAWTNDHVKRLLSDFDGAIKRERNLYFLGPIMLVDKGDDSREINDGQQRIVTFSLLCARLCRFFHEKGKDFEENQAMQMLFAVDSQKKHSFEKANRLPLRVAPPTNDQSNYKGLICGSGVLDGGSCLVSAGNQIEEYFDDKPDDYRFQLLEFLVKAVKVVLIDVGKTPDLNPHDVFETLNVRGKRLEDIELIKNHIFSAFANETEKSRQEAVYRFHEETFGIFRDIKKLSRYFRCYSQMRFGHIPENDFYWEFRGHISNIDDAAGFLYDFSEDAKRRASLYWNLFDHGPRKDDLRDILRLTRSQNRHRNILLYLQELKGYTVAYSVVFALFYRFADMGDSDKEKVGYAKFVDVACKMLCSLVVRVAHTRTFPPSHFEKGFAGMAKAIYENRCNTAQEFFDELKACDIHGVIPDVNYIEGLQGSTFAKGGIKKVRQILFGVANLHLQGAQVRDADCTLEHILPKSVKFVKGWKKFAEETHPVYCHRLGNLTLLYSGDNQPGPDFNKKFASKKAVYHSSCFRITKDLGMGRRKDWGPDDIKTRSKKIAEYAAKVWNFDK